MKLVHLTTVPQTLAFLSGQAGFFRRRGFEVHAISSPGAQLEKFCYQEQVQGYPVEMARRITPLRDLAAAFAIWRILRRVRPEIVHAHTPKGGLLGMIAAAAAGVPVRIFHLHGLPHLTSFGIRRRLLRWATYVACLVSRRVLCVSASVRDAAIREGLVPEWKINVPASGSVNGVDASRGFNPERLATDSSESLHAQYGIPPESLVMGFVGRLVRDKGLVEMADAWVLLSVQFPSLHWLLVGDSEPHDPLPSGLLDQLRRDPRIHWTGWRDDLTEVYGAMDLLVLPSYREGLPVVALEAAAMALPVVATRVPGTVDAVQDGITGLLVDPRNSQALANAIGRYLLDPQLRAAHGEAGRRRTLQEFQPESIWRAVEQEYVTLLREKGLKSPGPSRGAVAVPGWEESIL